MIREKEEDGNSNGSHTEFELKMASTMEAVLGLTKELSERLDEVESRKDGAGEAKLKLTNIVFDTTDERMPELTNIPLSAARNYARSMMLEHMNDPDVRSGKVKLSAILRTSYFRLLRSVGGVQLMRGTRLASEQTANEGEDEDEIGRMKLGAGIE